MARIHYSVELDYQVNQAGADFLLNIHAARTGRQRIVQESLVTSPWLPTQECPGTGAGTRMLRLRSNVGPLSLRYAATVDVDHVMETPGQIPETWVCNLPGETLPFLYPSRYCESDGLNAFAMREFGSQWQGYGRVQAICDWVRDHVAFVSGASEVTTTATDTLRTRQGVCRDFAHLMIAFCRALNIPARFATGLDYGADPALGPTDFHAYVEAYLGRRWYLFDPSGTANTLGLMRIGTGRDAADCAYATIFGAVTPQRRWLTVTLEGEQPAARSPMALSTDDGPPA